MTHNPAAALSSDPLAVLLRHNDWANRRILEICTALSDEEFARSFDIGPGSLRATTSHIIHLTRFWIDQITARGTSVEDAALAGPGRIALTSTLSASQLLHAWTAAAAELDAAAEASRATLHDPITIKWSKLYVFTKGAAFVHVTTHAMHHRAQCLNMLKRLGRPDIAEAMQNTAVVDWQSEVETKLLKVPTMPRPKQVRETLS